MDRPQLIRHLYGFVNTAVGNLADDDELRNAHSGWREFFVKKVDVRRLRHCCDGTGRTAGGWMDSTAAGHEQDASAAPAEHCWNDFRHGGDSTPNAECQRVHEVMRPGLEHRLDEVDCRQRAVAEHADRSEPAGQAADRGTQLIGIGGVRRSGGHVNSFCPKRCFQGSEMIGITGYEADTAAGL